MKTRTRLERVLLSVIILCSIPLTSFTQTPSLIASTSTAITGFNYPSGNNNKEGHLAKDANSNSVVSCDTAEKGNRKAILSRTSSSGAFEPHKEEEKTPKGPNKHFLLAYGHSKSPF